MKNIAQKQRTDFMRAPETDTAVFLGPSLDLEHARHTLKADFYPPAKMGDVYRLAATGIKTIVLIDGYFHGVAAIWQRELLAALDRGVRIIGAASMGALRAAELYAFGMEGAGQIFQWYLDGNIDGDDEVALLHTDAVHGYVPLSEPLVNIRYNLKRAVARHLISESVAEAMLTRAKTTWFGDRRYGDLLEVEPIEELSPGTVSGLVRFFDEETTDLKKQDAIRALEKAAEPGEVRQRSDCRQGRFYQNRALAERGFLHPAGYLVPGKNLLERINPSAHILRIREAATIFYLVNWARDHQIVCPPAELDRFCRQWENNITDLSGWLASNGLTRDELAILLTDEATGNYLVKQGPEAFGLHVGCFLRLSEIWRHGNAEITLEQSRKRAFELCFLNAWAVERGIDCDEERKNYLRREMIARYGSKLPEWGSETVLPAEASIFLADMSRAFYIREKLPRYFGYTSWHTPTALLQRLQFRGEAAEVAASITLEVCNV